MINNIYCVGRNYSEHVKELGNKLESDPIIFSKPNASLVEGNSLALPDFSNDVHFETEIVIKMNKDAFKITEQDAGNYFEEIAIGLDLTARDLQTQLKEKQLPWLLSKGFKGACYCSEFIQKKPAFIDGINFRMALNGIERQKANTNEMLFSINKIIAYISRFIQLKQGDLIYTGTPKGVGKLSHGDEIKLFIEDELMSILKVK